MIGKLRGEFSEALEDGSILIDVSGVSYSVRVTPQTIASNTARLIELFIFTAVREDAIDLYGFPSREELSFFKMLMSVSGIGPKTALTIMSAAETPTLKRTIATGDAGILMKVYGVGKKSAERIVVELKDKIVREQKERGIEKTGALPVDAEVLEALEALGYSSAESRRAIQSLSGDTAGVRERLAAALKHLGTPHPTT